MEITKRTKIAEWLVFLYLVLFPFGQIIRWGVSFGQLKITLHPGDIITGLVLLLFLLTRFPKPGIYRHIKNFLYISLFSIFFSLAFFKTPKTLYGSLYLLRFWGYSALFITSWNLVRKRVSREKLFNSLILVTFAVGIFGWIQYFFYPDIRPLVEWGWDDHLFRLVGTFLDPTFTSIILVFGFILSLAKYLDKKREAVLAGCVFFLITLAFTYSRAGYLALLAGALALLIIKKKVKSFIFVFLALLSLLILLPRPGSEGVKLERVTSVLARGRNYLQTFEIIKKSPLLGVGFNNFCLARNIVLGDVPTLSHSCSGSDASIMLVIAATGILGLISFLTMVVEVFKSLSRNVYGVAFIASASALGIHGFFSNSYFYAWVMGFMGILLALALREKNAT